VTLSRGDTAAANAVNAFTNYLNRVISEATADYVVANEQSQFGSGVTANNTASFSESETIPVTTLGAASTTGSTLTVDGNIAQAAAEQNLATNSLTITATNALNLTTAGPTLVAHAATGGLISVQSSPGGALALATSAATAQATGMVSNSTVDISGNTNLALARASDATNTVTVMATAEYDSGNTTTSASQGATVSATGTFFGNVSADIALHNVQIMDGGGTVSSNAISTIGDNDALAAGTQAVSGSTVTIDRNQTTAESDVHLASNMIALNAGSTLGASAGLNNEQFSGSDAIALVSGASGTGASVLSFSEPNATASTVALNANTTTARASGNTASNALNATASAQYSIPAGLSASANDGGGSDQAVAQYAVLNS
jgi:hypothetical protein